VLLQQQRETGGVYARCKEEGSYESRQIQIQIEEWYEEKGAQEKDQEELFWQPFSFLFVLFPYPFCVNSFVSLIALLTTMVTANVLPTPESLTTYDELRLGHKWHYIIYKIKDKKSIEIESKMSSDEKFDYAEFHKNISKTVEPRFIVLDYHYTVEQVRNLEKIVFIQWSPDNAPVSLKMLYASAKEDFKKKLQGIAKAHQATDQGELEESALQATLKSL